MYIEKYEECPHGKPWATQHAYDMQRCDCKTPHRISEVFAFIADNGEEGEGVVGKFMGDIFMPFVAADAARLESLRPLAKEIATKTGKTVKIIRLTAREEIETI